MAAKIERKVGFSRDFYPFARIGLYIFAIARPANYI